MACLYFVDSPMYSIMKLTYTHEQTKKRKEKQSKHIKNSNETRKRKAKIENQFTRRCVPCVTCVNTRARAYVPNQGLTPNYSMHKNPYAFCMKGTFFKKCNAIVDAQVYARKLSPMNACRYARPLWAFREIESADLEIDNVTIGASPSTGTSSSIEWIFHTRILNMRFYLWCAKGTAPL